MFATAPNWAEIATGVGTAVAALVFLLTAGAAYFQLREAKRTRLAALVADLSRRWDEGLVKTARMRNAEITRDELLQLVEQTWATHHADKRFYNLEALPNFFEGLAALTFTTKGVSIGDVDALWGSAVQTSWEKWEPAIGVIRRTHPTAYSSFEALYHRVCEHRQLVGVSRLRQMLARALWAAGDSVVRRRVRRKVKTGH